MSAWFQKQGQMHQVLAVLKSFIDKHSVQTDPIVADCYGQDEVQELMPTAHSTETQTPSIALKNRSCGSDKCLASNTAVVSNVRNNS